MLTIDITPCFDQINALIGRLHETYESVENPEFLARASLLAHDLPTAMKEPLLSFRLFEDDGICLISGFHVDDRAIGPTPSHWRNRQELTATRREDFYLALCSHLLGDAVAWATEQGGHLVHEVFPIKGNAGGQLGTSTDQLFWHTEDAFHPERMDYVCLLCLRNQDAIATTYASVDDLDLDGQTTDELFRPAYPFVPDEGNRADREIAASETNLVADLIRRSHARVKQMFETPDRVQTLFGDRSDPYIRIHPHYIADFSDDAISSRAFETLKGQINANLKDIILAPGDLLIMDNFKCVHGRREIPGRYDGTDRWLKRGFVVRDLRKTRELRLGPAERCVY